MRCFWLFCGLLLALYAYPATAQNVDAPDHFDFYMLDIATGADFCHVVGIEGRCTPPHHFALHGLWPQNNNGSYPVNCAAGKPLPHPESMLAYTPNLALIQHEWDKHGTCTVLGMEQYFAAAVRLYNAFHLPAEYKQTPQPITVEPEIFLDAFRKANPQLPSDGIVLGCNAKKEITQVAACYTKDLQPAACRNVHLCRETGPLTLPATPQ